MPKRSRGKLTYRKGINMKGRRIKIKTANQEGVTFQTGDNSAAEHSLTKIVKWSKEETLMLLKLYKKCQEEMNNASFYTNLYNKISRAMKRHGYSFKPRQCMTKISVLIKRYRIVKNQNSQGLPHKEWEYYDAMAEFLGDKVTSEAPIENEPQNIKLEIDERPNVMVKVERLEHEEGCENFPQNPADVTPDAGCVASPEEYKPQIKREMSDSSTNEVLKRLEAVRAENTELLQALIEKVQ